MHGLDLRYCYAMKSFLEWDGRRFKLEDDGGPMRRAKEVVLNMHGEVKTIEDDTERKALASWALRSEDEKRLRAMVSLARSDLAVHPRDLDRDRWLLNCVNGIVDLKTGEPLKHDRKYLMTRLAPVEYQPDATCPVWERFIKDTTNGDGEHELFLQVAAGYSITGDASEEKLFFAYGPTNTGKSTFLEAIGGTLGDYAASADFQTFIETRRGPGPSGDIARLAGCALRSQYRSPKRWKPRRRTREAHHGR